jgi:tRNA/tmRNA/rRNA uracil-C5-methylase (TrmA/RlmC/RlmD family)
MPKSLVERRLLEVSKKMEKARAELAVLDEQVRALQEEAVEARMDALVSESPMAAKVHQEAAKHAERMQIARQSLADQLQRWQRELDDLLDRLIPGSS